MPAQPNPVYDPATGKLKYSDGRTVDAHAPAASNSNQPIVQENITGNIGCCSKVYSFAIPTELIREAYRYGYSPALTHADPSIVITLQGERVQPPPIEFGVDRVVTAAITAVRWKAIPRSPFVHDHAQHQQTEEFAQWMQDNPPPVEPEDVPQGNVDQLKAWVATPEYSSHRLRRAEVALDVEHDRDPTRSSAVDYLESVIASNGEST